jgi:hypothetical protein
MKSNATRQASKHAAHPDSVRVRSSFVVASLDRTVLRCVKAQKIFYAASFDAAHVALQTFVPQAFFACSFAFPAD